MQRDPQNVLDIHVTVEEMTEGRAVIAKRILGTSLIRLVNEFQTTPQGASYVTTMTIGDDTALGKAALNRVARHRAFPPPRVRPWMRHHIEEIGNLENFLPQLHAARCDEEP